MKDLFASEFLGFHVIHGTEFFMFLLLILMDLLCAYMRTL